MARRPTPGAEMCAARCIHAEEVAHTRGCLEDEGTYIELAQVFGALADATRATIVHALLHQELCTCDLAAVVGISESGVSQHLRLLRALRLVKARRAGKFVYYSLDDAHIALLLQVGLTHLGHGADDETTAPDVPRAATVGGRR